MTSHSGSVHPSFPKNMWNKEHEIWNYIFHLTTTEAYLFSSIKTGNRYDLKNIFIDIDEKWFCQASEKSRV